MGRLLQRIIKYPPTRDIQADEKQLIWKFRFSLMSEKKALTKFVRSVDWSDIQVCKIISYISVYHHTSFVHQRKPGDVYLLACACSK
jgi:hypothetical protein